MARWEVKRLGRGEKHKTHSAAKTHHNSLQHLVANGWQHAVLVVLSQLLEDFRELSNSGAREDSQRHCYHLKVFRPCLRRNDTGACSHIKNVGVMNQWDPKVSTLGDHPKLDSREAIPHHTTVATIHCARIQAQGTASEQRIMCGLGGRFEREAGEAGPFFSGLLQKEESAARNTSWRATRGE